MAPKGRPPKPIEQKRKAGNPGKRALPAARSTSALEPAHGIPDPPNDIGPAGLVVWVNVWEGAQTWLAIKVDRATVERVCRLADECQRLREAIDQYGVVIDGPVISPRGDVVEGVTKLYTNPAIAALRAAERQLERDESNLGFNPVARSRLGLAEVKKQSAVELLLARRARRQGGETVEGDVIDVPAVD